MSSRRSRREFLTTVTLAAASAALPGCASIAATQRVDGLAPTGCRARYCRHFTADPLLAEGVGRCLLNARE